MSVEGAATPPTTTAYAPDLLWQDGAFAPGVLVVRDGRVLSWGPQPPEGVPVTRLPGLAVLPGFVNSHSHAFQRLLRGRAERPEPAASFWTWRAQMYRLVEQLTPPTFEAATTLAYREMRDAGFTRVKEFHYLHHGPGGTPYAQPNELALRVVQAARAAGVRVELERVVYLRGEHPAQARFRDATLDLALARCSALRTETDVPVGIAPHSVRAVDGQGFRACARWAADAGAELHAHVAEQPREVAECVAETGRRPVELLAELQVLGPRTVGVHLTHLEPHEVRLIGASGTTACLCPTTEANLGDGLPDLDGFLAAGAPLAIGSDSQAHIDPFLELRAVEYHGRLRALARTRTSPGALLAAALERHTPGDEARWVGVRLEHPLIADVPAERLADALVLSADRSVIALTAVGGDVRAPDPSLGPALRAFRQRHPTLGA